MLILHGSLHILGAHGSHDGSQVSGSLQNPGTVIMPPTIEDKIFGKPSFDPGFSKSLRHRSEVSRLCAFGRENPAFDRDIERRRLFETGGSRASNRVNALKRKSLL